MLKSCAVLLLLYVLSRCLSYRLPVISRYFNQQRRILSSSTSAQSTLTVSSLSFLSSSSSTTTSLKSIESNAYNKDSSIETFQSQEEYLEFLQTQCKLPKGKKYSTDDVSIVIIIIIIAIIIIVIIITIIIDTFSFSSYESTQCGSVGHPDHY